MKSYGIPQFAALTTDRLVHGRFSQYTSIGNIILENMIVKSEIVVGGDRRGNLPISSRVVLRGDQIPYPFSDNSS